MMDVLRIDFWRGLKKILPLLTNWRLAFIIQWLNYASAVKVWACMAGYGLYKLPFN